MKRLFLAALLAGAFLFAWAMPALAQDGPALYIDNKQVPVEPQLYNYGDTERASRYFMDIAPQIRENRAYVPLRAISVFLEAKIHWQSPQISLIYGETALTLTPGSKSALKNGADWDLDAAPHIKNGRTMVPVRFVAEAFGCKVGYANSKIYINTKPLYIKGEEVKALHQRTRMTMGGYIDECQSNLCIKEMQSF